MEKIQNILPGILSELKNPQKTKRQQLLEHWEKIAGPKIASHTKPSLGKEGKLFILVDQSTLAYELNQKHKTALLRRAQAQLGEKEIQAVYFKVGQIR